MQFRTKIHLAVATIIALSIIAAFILGRTVVFRKFLDVEEVLITQNIQRARNVVFDKISKIDSHAKDWGWWNATYDFVRDTSENFIRENLNATSLVALEVNYIFFIDASNTLVHSAGVNLASEQLEEVPEDLIQAVEMKAPLFVPANSSGGVSGIRAYPPYGIFLIASRHILRSEADGPANGTIVMMRRIDELVVREWERLIQSNIEVYASDDPALPQQVAAAFTNGDPRAKPILLRPDKNTIQGYSIVNDITGRPTLAIMVEGPRTVWAYARATVMYLMIALILLAIASFTISSLCLRRKVFAHAAHIDNEELKLSEQNLRKSNEELSRLYKSKTDFTSIVSHELRTPLGTVQQCIEILLDGIDGPINENQTERLVVAKRNVERLIKLANDILDLTRLDTGKIKLEFRDTDLNQTLEETAGLMKPLAEKKGLSITIETPDRPIHAKCDGDRIGQAIINLLSNAIRWTEGTGRITLKLSDAGADARIDVEDTGRGIEEERIPDLFKPFSQLRTKGSKSGEGTGMGLSISKRIVDAHKGKCEVKSDLGKGSTFTFLIPKAGPAEHA